MIPAKDVQFYNEAGYVLQQEFFDRDTIAELGRACDALCEKARDLTRNDDLYDLEDSHTHEDVRVRRLKRPTEMDPAFHRIARHPKLLDALAQLLGPAIRLSHPTGKVNIKGAEYGAPVEWHQDWAAYPHTNDDLLSVGIPLDDCMDENGPLLIIPDTHKGPIYDHHVNGVYCGGIDAVTSGIDFSKAVALTGGAGMVTFHHARAVHGSALNTSKRPRRLMLLQYAAVDAWPILGISSLDKFNAGIVRGEPTLEPRMVPAPIRIPLPIGPTTGSLYEQQRIMANRHFQRYDEVKEKVNG